MKMFQTVQVIVPPGPFVADFVVYLGSLVVRSVPPALDRALRVVPKR
jgi:hypothetical protein